MEETYSAWAAEYRDTIASDAGRLATADEIARYRNVVWHPGPTEHPPTAFTPEELGWLEGRYEPEVDAYLARRAPKVLAAINTWAYGAPTWQDVFKLFRMGQVVFTPQYKPRLYVESREELEGSSGVAFNPVIKGLAYRELKTLVVGLSKAGKSFLTWAKCAEAVRDGHRVLYLSEEPKATVADKLGTFGLWDAYGSTFFLTRRTHEQVRLMPWSAIVDGLAQDVHARRIDLVVVDTLRPWLGLSGDESNSADHIGKAIDALSPVSEAGAAVVVIHQSPWTGTRARGSTEFHAASDLIFAVEGEGEGPRTITYKGGRVEEVPAIQTFRWTAASIGEDLGKMRHAKANRLDEVLRVIEGSAEPVTVAEIAEQTEYQDRSIRKWMAELEKRGKVSRVAGDPTPGRGKDPDRWTRPNVFARLLGEHRESAAQ